MEDNTIIQLYWARDEGAIAATEEKYGGYCQSIALNVLGDAQEAEECVNDTYLHAWNAMPPQKPSQLAAFLGRITRNLSFDRYRRAGADKRGGGEIVLILDELSDCVSGGDAVQQEVERRELSEAINDFLRTLSPQKRKIFVLRYWYCESVNEIAAQFGRKPSAVSTALGRMRVNLRAYLEERGVTV